MTDITNPDDLSLAEQIPMKAAQILARQRGDRYSVFRQPVNFQEWDYENRGPVATVLRDQFPLMQNKGEVMLAIDVFERMGPPGEERVPKPASRQSLDMIVADIRRTLFELLQEKRDPPPGEKMDEHKLILNAFDVRAAEASDTKKRIQGIMTVFRIVF